MTKIRDDRFLMDFGKRVRELRIEKEMSQYQLSYASDIPKSQIVRIEQGEVNTGISSVAAIARALKIEPKDLF
ncbi:MAG: helix-turn-helix transcriptional regulator [Reichenbachiella sp.]|uniref:helix-turn-helix domain-containing protein n=1 Tax=Reichenbachiella sp. TaxID=2184521 RepID=UPI00326643FC